MTAGLRTSLRAAVALTTSVVMLLVLAAPAFAATFTVMNTNNEGIGSLRRAIEEANGSAGNTIAFNIAGSGPFTIAPTAALPTIQAENMTIDACTQPGADCSALPLTLKIRLEGQGFSLVRSGTTIRGFSFTGAGAPAVKLNRVAEEGIFVTQRNVTIADNYVGLAPDGSAAGKEPAFAFEVGNRNLSKVATGLHILDNVIGSNKAGTGAASAIDLSSTGFGTALPISGLRIEGNIIGLDPTGTQPRPNAGAGILVEESGGARIVGNRVADNKGAGIIHRGRTQTTPHSNPALEPGLLIEGNVIEGNEKEGLAIGIDNFGATQKEPYSGPADVFGNTIKGNGTAGSFAGISITEASDTQRPNIRIGGLGTGQGNTISGNTGAGVAIGASTGDTSVAVTVRGNSIFGNTGLPIDLGSNGATANAPAGTTPTGPNSLVNHPLIGTISHGSVIIDSTYEGPPNVTVTLDFYKSEAEAGPQAWIGSTQVTTDASGIGAYHAEFEPDVPAAWYIAATAIDANGSTSEFSKPLVVPAKPPAPPAPPATSGNPSASQPPTTQPGGSKPPKHGHKHKQPQKPGKPKLLLKLRPSTGFARPSSVVGFEITVSNKGDGAARGVNVCDRPPTGLTILRSEPAASGSGSTCWKVKSLAAGAMRVFRVTVQVATGSEGGVERNVATVSAANLKGVRSASAGVRVKPLPNTACGSRAFRPGIAPRC